MKKIILIAAILSSCSTQNIVEEKTETITPLNLAWGANHSDWDKALHDAVYSLPELNVEKPCKILSTKDCAIQLISIMAKYESSFKTESKYGESFNDSKGNQVISRGLLQISMESANQKAYSCNIIKAEMLHDATVNLNCAVKILAYQAKKSGTLIDGKRGGCSAYWSVCRNSSKSYEKIMNYMKAF